MTKRFLLLKKDNFFEFIDSEEAYFRTTNLEELLSIAEDTLNEQNIRIPELENKCEDLEQDNIYLEDRVANQHWKLKQRDKRIQRLENYLKERCEYQCEDCPVHNCKDRKEGVKMVKFEFQFVGYLECENKTEAQKILYAYERALGYLTRNDLNLYATELKEMPNEEVVTDD